MGLSCERCGASHDYTETGNLFCNKCNEYFKRVLFPDEMEEERERGAIDGEEFFN